MQKYSIFNLLRHSLSHHRNWQQAWRSPEPKKSYDAVIIGGGGHGLAAAYYLAKEHGLKNVAVLEKGWLGGGNVARNTTIVRSNYFLDANARLYEHSLNLWERLSAELNFNVMFSQRGILNLAHSDGQMDDYLTRGNAMRVNGNDCVLLNRQQVQEMEPTLDFSPNARYPIVGGLLQPRAGTARHDAVAWGYARAADSCGVDIIQNCEVTGIRRAGNKVIGVETNRGVIATEKVGMAVSGASGQVASLVGLRLPIETLALQACVTEPVKPVMDSIVTFGAAHFYVSQTDKGELVIGSDLDGYNSYSQRGGLPVIERAVSIFMAMFPQYSRLRMMRSWAGIVDMTMDGAPILGNSPVDGFYLNAGWCYGGFKATPAAGALLAHNIANDRPHPLSEPFRLERFASGHLIDEGAGGPAPGAH
jgi:heterotetrameric sarcosine oxidase beta subunit